MIILPNSHCLTYTILLERLREYNFWTLPNSHFTLSTDQREVSEYNGVFFSWNSIQPLYVILFSSFVYNSGTNFKLKIAPWPEKSSNILATFFGNTSKVSNHWFAYFVYCAHCRPKRIDSIADWKRLFPSSGSLPCSSESPRCYSS